ncbi:aminotransferase class V-fold PLP-dependent enzyme [Mesorhizobium sp. B2-5-13]|uniref:aminotransferase class V-fold PLP-dependent enzyme n=1 Tax=unclassified Mesorhizobium TaxID=325217 RepID=UPI001127DE5C|nr:MULTISPECIES: aminotransferase class V-fold PLP-dependent enzyme [unclassified Mesorhizobium]TPJ83351.1 aminotransferase class V-fold PLP-dependent enzyme [Mesorhizobium sp. B2-5-13]TPK44400.1 aminotransferase class V-fold PLP-dependent enzyme [Mesorhizobium sp. B2-5-5]TPL96898.1 aminotransferase class V-fold PLP-dependent enzyme [Mesorhizobium sp. B2-3-11]
MLSDINERLSIRERLGLRPIINVSGTMTALGASIMVPEAIQAMAEIAPEFVEIDDLQRKASDVIARLTGAECGFVTASAAAGIVMTVAGAMTGQRLLAIERLPLDTAGLRTEVIVQWGHVVGYGNSIDQAIRLCGGKPVLAGAVSSTQPYQVEEAINEHTAAGIYVVAHSTIAYGMLALADFAAICHAKSVPVIVDAASEYDLRYFLAQGADAVIYSGHKFLGGPTTGVVAGRTDLIRAAYLQNHGVGRGMKVGKESIAGVMAALEAWAVRDHEAIRARERAVLELWLASFKELRGIEARLVPDPTGNPLDRLEIGVKPASGYSAAGLAIALASCSPPIMVRAHQAELGIFFLDPCNLHPGEEQIVADRLVSLIDRPSSTADVKGSPENSPAGNLRWPD